MLRIVLTFLQMIIWNCFHYLQFSQKIMAKIFIGLGNKSQQLLVTVSPRQMRLNRTIDSDVNEQMNIFRQTGNKPFCLRLIHQIQNILTGTLVKYDVAPIFLVVFNRFNKLQLTLNLRCSNLYACPSPLHCVFFFLFIRSDFLVFQCLYIYSFGWLSY